MRLKLFIHLLHVKSLEFLHLVSPFIGVTEVSIQIQIILCNTKICKHVMVIGGCIELIVDIHALKQQSN